MASLIVGQRQFPRLVVWPAVSLPRETKVTLRIRIGGTRAAAYLLGVGLGSSSDSFVGSGPNPTPAPTIALWVPIAIGVPTAKVDLL